MAETQNVDDIRIQLAHCEEDMKRAAAGARDAVRTLHQATGIFGAPTQIDVSMAEEALARIREARLAYQTQAGRREELRALLADLENEPSPIGRTVSPAPAAGSAAPHKPAPAAAPPAQTATPWRPVAIVALCAFSALVVVLALLVVQYLAAHRQQSPAVPASVAQIPAPLPEVKPPESPKVSIAAQEFEQAQPKVQALLSAGKADDAIALLKELGDRYASDPIAPRIRAEIGASLCAKGDRLASAGRNAEALDVFRAVLRDYPGSEAAAIADGRLPDLLLALAKDHEDRAELQQTVDTLESLVKQYPQSPAAAEAGRRLPALQVRLAGNLAKFNLEQTIGLLRGVLASKPAAAEAEKARKSLAAALLQRADERGRNQQFKDEIADLREAEELDASLKDSAGAMEADALAGSALQAKDQLDVAGAVRLWNELQRKYPLSPRLAQDERKMQPLLDATIAAGSEAASNTPTLLWAVAQNDLTANQYDLAQPYLEKLVHTAAGTAQAANAMAALADHQYSVALEKLQAADVKGAQPVLEAIVRDYPQAPDAGPAGAELARIKGVPQGMVYIPAGEFSFGLSKERATGLVKKFRVPAFMEEPWFGTQEPANQVALKAYYMDEHPVTNDQYMAFVDATGRQPPPSADWQGKEVKAGCHNKPVTNVTWDDAAAYAKWAGKRLPTEAEWEKAARGTDGRLYPWGDDFDPSRFGFDQANQPRTVPVDVTPGTRSPYGVSDMIGDVQEWTASAFTAYPGADPTGLPFDGKKRVVRGVDAQTATLLPVLCLASTRSGEPPDVQMPALGFRCAKDAE